MELKITAFGIAKDILKKKQLSLPVEKKATVGEVRTILLANYPDFEKLISLKFAVNTEYVGDDYMLQPNDELVIIPPVSGG